MPDAVFRTKARLLSVLGDQLIRDEVVAIVELVKNSYDADAAHVTVELRGTKQRPEVGSISIADDGHGMTPEIVMSTWLEIATASKTPEEDLDPETRRVIARPKLSPGGRVQLGEKGVGRLAAMKLGKKITLTTRARGSQVETEIVLDTTSFGAAQYLEDVRLPVKIGPPKVFVDETHGTKMLIEHLNQPWSDELFRKLELALRRLAGVELAAFSIRLIAPDLETDRVLDPPHIGSAPYSLAGNVDRAGKFAGSMIVMNYLGPKPLPITQEIVIALPTEWEKSRRRRERGARIEVPTRVGPFRLDLRAFDLDPVGLRQAGLTVKDRDAIKELSGVSVYRDGFRIFPYGERGDDWLELDSRRVNNPTLRFSNNQIIGAVHITRLDNPELRDKTNREGFIENVAYHELRWLILSIISTLEESRFKVRPRRAPRPHDDAVLAAINDAKKAAVDHERTRKAVDRILTEYTSWSELVEQRNDILLQVAGIGMSAETVTHEIDRGVRMIDGNLKSFVAHLQAGASGPKLKEIAEVMAQHVADLQEIVALLQPLQAARRPKAQPQSIERIATSILRLFEADLFQNGIKADVTSMPDFEVECTRAELIQVFMNLVDNSIHWLRTVNDKKLNILIRGERKEVVVRDSGPGIKPEIAPYLFEPFFTTKEEGRGLGLYIVQDVMSRHGWSIDLAPSDPQFPGANFLLAFEAHLAKEGAER